MMYKVEQIDRGNAARLCVERWTEQHGNFYPWMTASIAPIILGTEDDSLEVQAFAKHRLQALGEVKLAGKCEIPHTPRGSSSTNASATSAWLCVRTG